MPQHRVRPKSLTRDALWPDGPPVLDRYGRAVARRSVAFAGQNRLWHGDNLDVLRVLQDECVDLVYLDPPFKSNQDYNMLYKERDGSRSAAQKKAFGDTWKWDAKAAKAYRQIVEAGGSVSDVMDAFRRILTSGADLRQRGRSEMLAYLSMMAPRLVELRRVLKPTGSLYLHCDPVASHYLKLLLDAVFGQEAFRNEIVWLRSKNPKGSQHGLKRYSPFTDSILYYAKSADAPLHLDRIRRVLSAAELKRKYPLSDHKGPYADGPILRSASMGPRPNLVYEYKGFTPGPAGWRVKRSRLEVIDARGDLAWTNTGAPRRKIRPDDAEKGQPVGSFWGDIPPVNSQARERVGFPTQKPTALLRRIIAASSDEGGTVLDPFCGCGSTIEAAEDLRRRWIGIDITHLAIEVICDRLAKRGLKEGKDYTVDSRFAPATMPDVETLARKDKHAFQGWALQQAGIEPFQLKPGPDRGIDARKVFFDPPGSTQRREIIVSVKGGNLPATCVRDLIGTVQRERAQMGVLITLKPPTKNMVRDAADAPVYRGSDGRLYAGIQILTVQDLLNGHTLEYPLQLAVANAATVPATAARSSFALKAEARPRKMVKAGLPLGFGEQKQRRRPAQRT